MARICLICSCAFALSDLKSDVLLLALATGGSRVAVAFGMRHLTLLALLRVSDRAGRRNHEGSGGCRCSLHGVHRLIRRHHCRRAENNGGGCGIVRHDGRRRNSDLRHQGISGAMETCTGECLAEIGLVAKRSAMV